MIEVQQLRGSLTTVPASTSWVGPLGVLLVDTDIWAIRIQDGITPGGHLVNSGAFAVSLVSVGSGLVGHPTNIVNTGTISLSIPVVYTDGGTGLTGPYSNGQLLIGNGTGFNANTLTAGNNVTITNSSGAITVAVASGATTAIVATSGLSVATSSGTATLSFNGKQMITRAATGNTTLTASDYYVFFNLSAGATATMPASPSIGDAYVVVDEGDNFNANNLVVSGNGHNLSGGFASRTMNISGQAWNLVFAPNSTWRIY